MTKKYKKNNKVYHPKNHNKKNLQNHIHLVNHKKHYIQKKMKKNKNNKNSKNNKNNKNINKKLLINN
jgi:hypothetical protein